VVWTKLVHRGPLLMPVRVETILEQERRH
jgi:hypothetical protein